MSVEEQAYIFCPTCKNPLERSDSDGESLLSCSNCGFVFWNNPKPVVSIILIKDGKILMLKRAKEPLNSYWCLPGGYVRYDETPEESVIREAHEETGAEIAVQDLVGVYRIDNDPSGVHIDIIYSGTSTGEVKLSEEDSTYEYFNIDNLPDKIAYKHRKAIRDWKKFAQP